MPYDNERIDAQGWSPDSDLVNADWLKTMSWPFEDNAAEFIAGGLAEPNFESLPKSEQRRVVSDFMRLPVARNMPEVVKEGLKERGLL